MMATATGSRSALQRRQIFGAPRREAMDASLSACASAHQLMWMRHASESCAHAIALQGQAMLVSLGKHVEDGQKLST